MKLARHLIGLIEGTLTAEHSENIFGASDILYSCLLTIIQP